MADGVDVKVVAVVAKVRNLDNETSIQRLSRLVANLIVSTKDGAQNLTEKALSTMEKIQNMCPSTGDLVASGAVERINILRKHPTATISAKAKDIRVKWMEAARIEALARNATAVGVAIPQPECPVEPVDAVNTTEHIVENGRADLGCTVPQQIPSLDDVTHFDDVTSSSACVRAKDIAAPSSIALVMPDGVLLPPTFKIGEKQTSLFYIDRNSIIIFSKVFDYGDVIYLRKYYGIQIIMHLTDVLPDEVKSSVPRFRAAKMLHTALGRPTGTGPTSGVCATAAAVWLENKVYRAVCAVAIETSNQANSQHAAQSSSTVQSKGGSGGGDTTVTTQGAGSAFNKYLANVTRLTFALQVRIYKLRSLIISPTTISTTVTLDCVTLIATDLPILLPSFLSHPFLSIPLLFSPLNSFLSFSFL